MGVVCEKCGIENEGTFGSGRFCSRSCANSRIRTEETKQKISESMKKQFLEKGCPEKNELQKEALKKASRAFIEKCKKELMEADFSTLKYDRLRKRLLAENGHICNKCKLTEWLDQPIALEVEHKDGNNQNNTRENLEMLCPNCHAQTETWRGRNKRCNKPKKVSDDEIVDAFIETGNIRQCLIRVGLAPKGANYGRVKRCLTLRGIPYKKNSSV